MEVSMALIVAMISRVCSYLQTHRVSYTLNIYSFYMAIMLQKSTVKKEKKWTPISCNNIISVKQLKAEDLHVA